MTDSSRFTDVRMKGFGPRAPVAGVLAALDARTAPLPAEAVPLAHLAGRVLAEAVASPVDVPAFERAAMDGYAVRAADTSPAVPLLVRGEAMPARPFSGTVGAGEAVRITTGSPVPAGADSVLMAELAEPHADGRVTAREPVVAGKHIARVGEDVAKGRVVLAAGRVLRPQDVGLLASIGVGAARVHRRPRVALLVTGNELLPPGDVPTGFRIVDSNSPMLAALVARDGGDPLPVRYLADDFAAVRDAIRDADADAVLVSGGTSVGTADHAPAAVAELGELAFHGVALRPAGPFGVGFLMAPRRGEGVNGCGGDQTGSAPVHPFTPSPRPVFLLPGNPVSCLCAYDLFAGRVVRRLGGRSWELPYRSETLPLASRVPSATGRTDYVRVRIDGGTVVPILGVGASNLSSAVAADGFVLVPPERDEVPAGEVVVVWRYDG
jgi:molybdopterin molybdotransferase